MTRGGAVAPGSNPLSPRLLGDSLTGWRLPGKKETDRRQGATPPHSSLGGAT